MNTSQAKVFFVLQDTATKLTPTGQPFGCKRQAVDTDYYITYNRPNVELVDLRRGGA